MALPNELTPQQARELWVKALRSGQYQQTKDVLRDDSGYCCLGVACDVYHKTTGKGEWKKNEWDEHGFVVPDVWRMEETQLPECVCDWLGLLGLEGRTLRGRTLRS